jgi:uncharacterized protein
MTIARPTMQPFFFGTSQRRLFGVYHPPPALAPRRRESVLLCAPFGQEALRTHRLLRVLAERLARDGFHAMRFDPFGSGDSAGSDEGLDLAGWQTDIEAAHDELMRRSPSDHWAVWVALRLAAAPAVRASRVAPGVRLVLLEPIVDGARYLRHLRERHVDSLEASFDIVDPAWRRSLSRGEDAEIPEAMGFGLSGALKRELIALTPTSLPVPAACEIAVLAHPGDGMTAGWVAHQRSLGASVTLQTMAHDFDWNTEEAINTALVPGTLLQRLIEEIRPS